MPEMGTKQRRDASLDLFRIISMLLIISLHSIDHSGVLEAAPGAGTAAYLYVRFMYMLCQICVNCYVMLSGYFLLHSRFRVQKLAGLWMETAFYSFIIKLVFMLTGSIPLSAASLFSCFFPVFTGRYWFITIYVGLYLLSPFLNIAINAMDKRQHALLNITLALLFSAWSSIHPAAAGMNSGGGWGLAWFTVLYFSAAWFRLYYTPSNKTLRFLMVWIGVSLATAAIYCFLGEHSAVVKAIAGNWFRYDALPVYISTLAVFVCFLNIRVPEGRLSKTITFIAPSTLGVYLIHAHANMSPFIWRMLDLPGRLSDPFFPAIQLLVVLGIFGACVVLDVIRRFSLGRLETSSLMLTVCGRVGSLLRGIWGKIDL